jgi:hypothetical protein
MLSQSQSQSHLSTDGQSVRQSWYRAPSGTHDQILVLSDDHYRLSSLGDLSDERVGLSFVESLSLSYLHVYTEIFILVHTVENMYNMHKASVSPEYAKSNQKSN